MDPSADDVTAEDLLTQDRIDGLLDRLGDRLDEIVPDAGEPATAEDMEGVYKEQVREVVLVPLIPPAVVLRPNMRVRVSRPRRRERRPGCVRRRTPRATRAVPSDPDKPGPGDEAGLLDELTGVAS